MVNKGEGRRTSAFSSLTTLVNAATFVSEASNLERCVRARSSCAVEALHSAASAVFVSA